MAFVPPPQPHVLLPPLLACLPTAFVSPRPPPALLPLLTPILRQRVHMNAPTSSSDNWLPLLSWDADRASKLPDVVERIQVEPHPVSGEVEIEEPRRISFRRLDSETLHTKFELDEFELLPVYLWCPGDDKGDERGWMLAELRSLEDIADGTQWHDSIAEANEHSGITPTNGNGSHFKEPRKDSPQVHTESKSNDDDDDYWAAYDRTPSQTPMNKRSPAPPSSTVQVPTSSEIEYFARYMSEVQPALDPEDPDEDTLQPGQSTLNGNILVSQRALAHEPLETSNLGPQGYDSSFPVIPNGASEEHEIASPQPSSPRSHSPVEKLEQRARSVSSAEFGIKQHISTDMKSLYRLAKSAGIELEEFQRIVKTELEVLSLMDTE